MWKTSGKRWEYNNVNMYSNSLSLALSLSHSFALTLYLSPSVSDCTGIKSLKFPKSLAHQNSRTRRISCCQKRLISNNDLKNFMLENYKNPLSLIRSLTNTCLIHTHMHTHTNTHTHAHTHTPAYLFQNRSITVQIFHPNATLYSTVYITDAAHTKFSMCLCCVTLDSSSL